MAHLIVRRPEPEDVNIFVQISAFEYRSEQRRRFASGKLRRDWFRLYSHLFDEDDFRRAENRSNRYFYEWLGAIVLYHSTGFFSLVTKYQHDSRKRALLPKIVSPSVVDVLNDRATWGKAQGPDLLMYAPDYSDWFFCEAKGPNDRISSLQRAYFKELFKVSGKRIRLLEFRQSRYEGHPR